MANGVSVVGRSFKYHRPRGIWGAWTEEPNAIVDVTRNRLTTPNLRATTEALENDLAVRSVNAAPTAAADRAALIDRLAPVLPAGFYYKTFLLAAMGDLRRPDPRHGRPRPRRSEQSPAGRQSAIQRPLRSPRRRRGPAGLAAAAAGARAGRVVFLVDDHAEIGGQFLHRGGVIEGGSWRDWAQGVVRAVEAAGGRVMTRTTAYGVYDGNLVCAWERRPPAPDALWRIRPQRIVVAAGAIERPLIVPDNDRPGVMSADAALVYLKLYAVLIGKRVVVATNNDSAYPVAEALAEAGAEVELVDMRADGPASPLRRDARGRSRGRHREPGRRSGARRRTDARLRRPASVRRMVADGASLRPGARAAALRRARWPRSSPPAGSRA